MSTEEQLPIEEKPQEATSTTDKPKRRINGSTRGRGRGRFNYHGRVRDPDIPMFSIVRERPQRRYDEDQEGSPYRGRRNYQRAGQQERSGNKNYPQQYQQANQPVTQENTAETNQRTYSETGSNVPPMPSPAPPTRQNNFKFGLQERQDRFRGRGRGRSSNYSRYSDDLGDYGNKGYADDYRNAREDNDYSQYQYQNPSPIPPPQPEQFQYHQEQAHLSHPLSQGIPPEIRNILLLMSDEITFQTPDEEILKNPVFGLNRLEKTAGNEPMHPSPDMLVNVPSNICDFFVEAFAQNQPLDVLHRLNKDFSRHTTLFLSIPFTLPVSFYSIPDNKTQIGLYDTPIITAKEAHDLVTYVLNTIAIREMRVYHFEGIDAESFNTESLEKISRDLNVKVAISNYYVQEESELLSVDVNIMLSHISSERLSQIDDYMQKVFVSVKTFMCSKCKCIYCDNDGSECIIYYHSGEQIPLESGVMEEMDYDDETQECVTIVRYTCCGECVKEDGGCKERKEAHHQEDPTYKNSKMSISTQPIFQF